MNTKHLLSSVSAIGLAAGLSAGAIAPANATDGTLADKSYVGVFGGFVPGTEFGFEDDTDVSAVRTKDGFSVGGVLGTEILPMLRGELELSYWKLKARDRTQDGNDTPTANPGTIEAVVTMANLWKEFGPIAGALVPYLGGGVGLAYTDMDLTTDDAVKGDDLSMAGQVGAGLRVLFADNFSADIAYRFKGIIDAHTLGNTADDSISRLFTHSIHLGLNYHFGGNSAAPADGVGGSDIYFTVFGGGSFPQRTPSTTDDDLSSVKLDEGFTAGVAVGTNLVPGLRAEAEYSFVNHDPKSYTIEANDPEFASGGNVDQHLLLLNLWKDVHLGFASVYAGGGLGIGIVDGRLENLDTDETHDDTNAALAAQFGAGVRFGLTDNWTLDASYRFKGSIGALIKGVPGTGNDHGVATFTSHNIQLGATYHFGGAPVIEAASGGPDWYVSVFSGAAFDSEASVFYTEDHYEYLFRSGFTVGAAVGTEVSPGLRTELEASYISVDPERSRNNGPDDNFVRERGTLDQYFILGNVWKDFKLPNGIAPYVGGGLGIGIVDANVTVNGGDIDINDTSVGFAGQFGAGMRFGLTDNLVADVGYRYKSILSVLLEGQAGADDHSRFTLENHVVQGGVSWTF